MGRIVTPTSRKTYFFNTPFGTGVDGDVTITTDTAAGYKSSFGVKQYENLTIAEGASLFLTQGDNSGAIIIAVRNTLTINGSVVANGTDGADGVSGASGAGGDSAGGGTGGASKSSNAHGASGSGGSVYIHGCASGGGGGAVMVDATGTWNSGSMVGTILTKTEEDINFLSYQAANCLLKKNHGIPEPTSLLISSTISGFNSIVKTIDFIQGIVSALAGYGGSTYSYYSGTGYSGGGGGAGGIIYIEAKHIIFGSGNSMSAIGGDGGDGYGSAAKGGNGGGGGRFILICNNYSGSPNTNVVGGAGGIGSYNGAAGPDGEFVLSEEV